MTPALAPTCTVRGATSPDSGAVAISGYCPALTPRMTYSPALLQKPP